MYQGGAAGTTSQDLVITGVPLPPDPGGIAPPVDPSVATTLSSASEFLFTGDDPIQKGVDPGAIEPLRVSVLRGQVLDRAGQPLAGVTITAHGHPEFGHTLSRADGMFDLAVNGGGLLILQYEREGFLPAQRQVEAPWQDYRWLPGLSALEPRQTIKVTTRIRLCRSRRGRAVWRSVG